MPAMPLGAYEVTVTSQDFAPYKQRANNGNHDERRFGQFALKLSF